MATNDQRRIKRNKLWYAKFGPWALVTGASDGIGKEFAHRLGRKGMNLVLIARRRDVLDELAANVKRNYGVQAVVINADMASKQDILRVIDETQDIDIGLLIACAGFGTSGSFIDSPVEIEIEMLDVNCRAVLSLTHAFGQRFAERGRGGIILLSSIVAFQGVPQAANYAATKAYIQSLAEGLHTELSTYGVDVISSAPGPIQSGFAKRANMRLGMALKPSAVASATLTGLGRYTTVRPGLLSKFLELALTLPRWARIRIMTIVMGGMTKHQRQPITAEAKGGV